jgi:hypothetical protein
VKTVDLQHVPTSRSLPCFHRRLEQCGQFPGENKLVASLHSILSKGTLRDAKIQELGGVTALSLPVLEFQPYQSLALFLSV